MKKEDELINNKTIRCRCGKIVSGNSRIHAESNLKIHKKSKEHKKNIKLMGDKI